MSLVEGDTAFHRSVQMFEIHVWVLEAVFPSVFDLSSSSNSIHQAQVLEVIWVIIGKNKSNIFKFMPRTICWTKYVSKWFRLHSFWKAVHPINVWNTIYVRLHFAVWKCEIILNICAYIASSCRLLLLCKVSHGEMMSHQPTNYGKTMIKNII